MSTLQGTRVLFVYNQTRGTTTPKCGVYELCLTLDEERENETRRKQRQGVVSTL